MVHQNDDVNITIWGGEVEWLAARRAPSLPTPHTPPLAISTSAASMLVPSLTTAVRRHHLLP